MANGKRKPGAAHAIAVRGGRRSASPLRLQVQPARPERWTAAKEEIFLTELALSANVRHSLRQVGMSAASLYYRRRTNVSFEAAWDSALSQGYSRLEADMLSRAISDPAIGDAADVAAGPPMSDTTRMALLSAHAKRVGQYRAGHAGRVYVDTAKLRREITERLDNLARSLGLEVRR